MALQSTGLFESSSKSKYQLSWIYRWRNGSTEKSVKFLPGT